eukprot:1159114-Pelagomonas_calceolata.AAC.11
MDQRRQRRVVHVPQSLVVLVRVDIEGTAAKPVSPFAIPASDSIHEAYWNQDRVKVIPRYAYTARYEGLAGMQSTWQWSWQYGEGAHKQCVFVMMMRRVSIHHTAIAVHGLKRVSKLSMLRIVGLQQEP